MRISTTRPRHSQDRRLLPSLASTPICRRVVSRVIASREQQVAKSVVRSRCPSDSNVRSNAQSHRRHGENNRIAEVDGQRVHASQYAHKRCYTTRTLCTTAVDRSDRKSTVHSYIPDTHFFRNFLVTPLQKPLEPPETSGHVWTILDPSRSFSYIVVLAQGLLVHAQV